MSVPAPLSPNDGLDPPVVDFPAARERMGGDQDLLRELCEIFLQDHQILLTELKSALNTGNWEGAERSAHSLKGIAANLGGLRVQAAAFSVEEAARAAQTQLASAAVELLCMELDRLGEMLHRSFPEMSAGMPDGSSTGPQML